MENLGEFWWVVPVGAFVGAILLGYGRRPADRASTIQGAAIISSQSAEALTNEVRRAAVAAEHIAEVLQHDSDEAARLRKDGEIAELRAEIARLRRSKD